MKDQTPWRTPEVLAACKAFREARSVVGLSDIAEMALAAGYEDDGSLIAVAADPDPLFRDALRAVVRIEGGDEGLAQLFFEDFVEELKSEYDDDPDEEVMTYEKLMAAAADYVETGENVCQQGSTRWQSVMGRHLTEFWKHYKVLTGKTFKQRGKWDRGHIFTCSC